MAQAMDGEGQMVSWAWEASVSIQLDRTSSLLDATAGFVAGYTVVGGAVTLFGRFSTRLMVSRKRC